MTSSGSPRILLGVTGGVAAYKAAELCRLFVKSGVEVRVAMTQAACRFVTPTTMQALSGHPVAVDLWDGEVDNGMPHIELSRDQDRIVVAPASADFLAKVANGLADDLLSTLCLARECALSVAPAMNRQMWDNAATRRNIERLRADGVEILGPGSGDQACGEVGLGRMLEPEQLHQAVLASLQPKVLRGVRAVVTAGPTFEAIDPVRGITNRSSGRMGYAVAEALLASGAEVVLVSGPTALTPPYGAELVNVSSAQQMLEAVLRTVAGAQIFVAVAAVADYRVKEQAIRKIKKADQSLTLDLEPTADILATVSTAPNPPFCVGFAAESHDLDRFAEEKRRRKKLPLLAANLAQEAIGHDDNALVLFDDRGRHPLPRGPKVQQARLLVAHLAQLYRASR